MYEVRGPRFRRLVLGPISGAFVAPLSITAAVCLFIGDWFTIGAACFLLLIALRSAMTRCVADSKGLTVTNRLLRHRIPWAHVRAIWVPDRKSQADLVPTLRVERRASVLSSISVYATLGMRRERLHSIALDLQSLAKEDGYSIVARSRAEVDAQLEDRH